MISAEIVEIECPRLSQTYCGMIAACDHVILFFPTVLFADFPGWLGTERQPHTFWATLRSPCHQCGACILRSSIINRKEIYLADWHQDSRPLLETAMVGQIADGYDVTWLCFTDKSNQTIANQPGSTIRPSSKKASSLAVFSCCYELPRYISPTTKRDCDAAAIGMRQ